MPDQKDAVDPIVPASEPALRAGRPTRSPVDLCREVERTLDLEPGDRVRCVHLFGDYYRCNWWSRVETTRKKADYDWSALLTDHVRRSSFLKVTTADGQLKVEEVADESGKNRNQ